MNDFYLDRAGLSRATGRRQDDLTAKIARCLLASLVVFLSACGTGSTATTTPGVETPRAIRTDITTPAPPTPTSTPVPTSTLGLTAEDLAGVTLTLWHPWSGELGQGLQDAIDSFNAENPYGISAQGLHKGGFNDLYAAIESAGLAALPDLVVAYPYQIRMWDSRGLTVADLELYLSDPEWGFGAGERDAFYQAFFGEDQPDGKRSSFPLQRNAEVLYYNVSWARELGFDLPPQTPKDFRNQACAAAQANASDEEASNDGTGGWVINATPPSILSWMYAFGSEILAPGGKGYRFNSPASAEMIAFLNDLHDSGCAWESAGPYNEVEFASRQGLFITAPLADYPYQIAELERAGNDDDWGVIPFPSLEGAPVVTLYGPDLAVFAGSPEEVLASWLLIKWLSAPEQQARLIAAGDTLPLSNSAADQLQAYANANPQWSQALALLEFTRREPDLPSWSVVRWVVGDVGTQIFRSYFTSDRTQATLELMDETAAELNARFEGNSGP
jgi:ABC-type glycerol-3-phosphate transport system substrate-binding protein